MKPVFQKKIKLNAIKKSKFIIFLILGAIGQTIGKIMDNHQQTDRNVMY
jgi:hypothetical protein